LSSLLNLDDLGLERSPNSLCSKVLFGLAFEERVSTEEEDEQEEEEGCRVETEDGGGKRNVSPVFWDEEALSLSLIFSFRGLPRWRGLGVGGEGGAGSDGGGRSLTLGRPTWGPLRFRMEEKCSQSW